MKHVIKIAFALTVICGLHSCRNHLSSKEYLAYIHNSNNGLIKAVLIGQWEYDIQYKPYDYILMSEQLKPSERNSRLSQLEGTACFNISFKNKQNSVSALRADITSQEMYNLRINYFNNEAINDIRMVYGNSDTLHPTSFVFENNYNLTPQETIVVGFTLPGNEKVPSKDMQIIYNDKVYKNGIVKAKISKEAIEKIPSLVL